MENADSENSLQQDIKINPFLVQNKVDQVCESPAGQVSNVCALVIQLLES